jgi:predicted Rossmann fold nucleotide-binding protein DprA/Smf involved in DNA uptake
MTQSLSPNTQAILLLTAPLNTGRSTDRPALLAQGEYNKLARALHDKKQQPADLFGPDATKVLRECVPPAEHARFEALLGRGFLLSQAVERWQTRSIWIISRADEAYPRRLKTRLKEDAPPILYGCGDINLLESGGLAVVGSRHVNDEIAEFAQNTGRLDAQSKRTIVSGGAKGIDQAATQGALLADGCAVSMLADSLEPAALSRANREPLMEKRLTLASPFDPNAGFNVGHAMQRNKLIYALSDAALVVSADLESGGTWAGAIEQLKRYHFVPVYICDSDQTGKGNAALLVRGGRRWPNPQSVDELNQIFASIGDAPAPEPVQSAISFDVREPAEAYTVKDDPSTQTLNAPQAVVDEPQIEAAPVTHHPPAEKLMHTVREILLSELEDARAEDDIAELLNVSAAQAKAWLKQLVSEGLLTRHTKPVRYSVSKPADRLL